MSADSDHQLALEALSQLAAGGREIIKGGTLMIGGNNRNHSGRFTVLNLVRGFPRCSFRHICWHEAKLL